MTRLVAYGTRGFLVEGLVPEGPERASRLAVFAELLRGRLPRAEVVVGAGMLGVFGASSREELTAACDELDPARLEGEGLGTEHRIEVAYDGPDLAELSARTGLAERELIELHSGAEYQVEFLGFAPGFAYLGGLDPRLRLPRRGTPRPRVAAGSLAIAEGYTGIYPFDGPGGWHLLGRTLGAEIFEPSREPAARLRAGDRVRFVESTAPSEFELRVRPRPSEVAGSHLLIERSEGFVTVQDGGRPGRLAEGLPRSGAISPLALRLANESV
ncbi:MAG TPA: carboxyltransferase domain-containing protein, partial [Polyangiaceae bacterium]|nr:carboxyltransferase domain-containing protein [Polyangiaceae bacterium]